MTITATDMQLSGLVVPAKADGTSLDTMLFYERASSGPIKVTSKGTEVFSVAGMEANVIRRANDAGLDYDATVSGIKADLSKVEDPKSRDMIQKLGMTTIDGKASLLGAHEVFEGDYRKMFDAPATYEKVTREDLQKAAALVLNKKHRTVGTLKAPVSAATEARP